LYRFILSKERNEKLGLEESSVGRDGRTVKNHFISNNCLKDLRQVESITIDMNAGYVNVIKEIFPQAKIIIDRFHLVQLISRSMNKTRVRVMNTLKTSNGEP